ncbi:MAG: sugar phosphate isomerase/epimerase [Planctomycetia bacterium]|nr:sugar phosphate isomerase/epimerase [Planctomycetia bacterium]
MSANRRSFLKAAACVGGWASVNLLPGEEVSQEKKEELVSPVEGRIALNLGTILQYKLPFLKQLELAAQVGFQNVEIWLHLLEQYLQEGGTLEELRSRLSDWNLRVVGAIGFTPWGVNDDTKRRQAMETMKRDMERMAALGATTLAAAPAGIYNRDDVELAALAGRYRELLELGETVGVFPQLEIWGAGQTLSKLSDATWVVVESAHPQAALLLDVYHLFRGGNDFTSLRQLNGRRMTNFHWNDYPGNIPREEQKDGDRVFPGEGVAPLVEIAQILRETGFTGTFSLEIFNRNYVQNWSNPLEMLQVAYRKMRDSLQKAGI